MMETKPVLNARPIPSRLQMNELNTDKMDLDVLCRNESGQAFRKSAGFRERWIIMRKKS